MLNDDLKIEWNVQYKRRSLELAAPIYLWQKKKKRIY